MHTAGGTGNRLPKRHTSEPPRLVSPQNAAVPWVILMFASVCVIFINRLTHRPSPCISVSRGPECLLSTFPVGLRLPGPLKGRQRTHLPFREASRDKGAHPSLCPNQGTDLGVLPQFLPPACLTVGGGLPTTGSRDPPPQRLFPLLLATMNEHLLYTEICHSGPCDNYR